MNYWLFKSEPDEFSIEDLRKKSTSIWDGVRNYQARNFLRDEVKKGDLVLFYHSSCENVGVAGIAEVSKTGIADPSSFDAKSPYFDPKSSQEAPRWITVEVKFKKAFKEIISLQSLKQYQKLQQMRLLQRGNRLSIMPVSKAEFDFIIGLAKP